MRILPTVCAYHCVAVREVGQHSGSEPPTCQFTRFCLQEWLSWRWSLCRSPGCYRALLRLPPALPSGVMVASYMPPPLLAADEVKGTFLPSSRVAVSVVLPCARVPWIPATSGVPVS